MKKMLLILVMVIGLSGCATTYIPPVQKNIEKSWVIDLDYETAWTRAMQWFALNGVGVSNSDKDAGVISSSPKTAVSVKYMDCGNAELFYEGEGVISLFITKENGSTRLQVVLQPTAIMYMNFGSHNRVPCASLGIFEKEVKEYFNTGVFTPFEKKETKTRGTKWDSK